MNLESESRHDAVLPPLPGDYKRPFTVDDFMRDVVLTARPWVRPKPSSNGWTKNSLLVISQSLITCLTEPQAHHLSDRSSQRRCGPKRPRTAGHGRGCPGEAPILPGLPSRGGSGLGVTTEGNITEGRKVRERSGEMSVFLRDLLCLQGGGRG